MKRELNIEISKIAKFGEEELFREMANQFNRNKYAKCTYVQEVHKMIVEFNSSFYHGVKGCELGDLLFLTYDKTQKELRLCVLQAKYRKGSYRKFLSCKADEYQWELLFYRPDIHNKSRLNFPKHILNFRHDYKSITAYGIFYHDKTLHEIDFLYTLPELFKPQKMTPVPSKTFSYICPNLSICKSSCCGCNTSCLSKIGSTPKETLFTCNMDIFEREVLTCKVGAPINDDEIRKYILGLLNSMKKTADSPEVIDEILHNYDYIEVSKDEEYPSAIIIVTDGEKYKKRDYEDATY